MNGRRRKDEPFNPFAPNASQKARDRKDRAPRPVVKSRAPEPAKPSVDLAAKQKAAMEAIRQRREAEEKKAAAAAAVKVTAHKPSQQPKAAPKTSIKKPDNREDRLASLRAKSAATAKFAKDAQDAMKVENGEVPITPQIPEIEVTKEIEVVNEIVLPESEIPVVVESGTISGTEKSSNVFKTISTPTIKVDKRPKRRRPGDKKGGGRQPQARKLDRRKYLEYKYIAKDLLDNEAISEEHRSNILGQIWAKGERIGVSESLEFINQKEAELIIPSDVAEEFRRIVKRYTTKR